MIDNEGKGEAGLGDLIQKKVEEYTSKIASISQQIAAEDLWKKEAEEALLQIQKEQLLQLEQQPPQQSPQPPQQPQQPQQEQSKPPAKVSAEIKPTSSTPQEEPEEGFQQIISDKGVVFPEANREFHFVFPSIPENIVSCTQITSILSYLKTVTNINLVGWY